MSKVGVFQYRHWRTNQMSPLRYRDYFEVNLLIHLLLVETPNR